jgi:hypothetical protein
VPHLYFGRGRLKDTKTLASLGFQAAPEKRPISGNFHVVLMFFSLKVKISVDLGMIF